MQSQEKKTIKADREVAELPYMTCTMDGRVEKASPPQATSLGHIQLTESYQVGNFRVEPPGLFRGRGEHPKMGLLKVRIRKDELLHSLCLADCS